CCGSGVAVVQEEPELVSSCSWRGHDPCAGCNSGPNIDPLQISRVRRPAGGKTQPVGRSAKSTVQCDRNRSSSGHHCGAHREDRVGCRSCYDRTGCGPAVAAVEKEPELVRGCRGGSDGGGARP